MREEPKPEEETKPEVIETFDVDLFETSIPEELQKQNRWVLRRGKIPVGTWSDPRTHLSFDGALDAYRSTKDSQPFSAVNLGIGFLVLPEDEITFIDFDKCFPDHEEEVRDILKTFASWTEFSRSGNGVHIFGYGKTDRKGSIKTTLPFGVEVYSGGGARHCAMTGRVYGGYEHFGKIGKQTESFLEKYEVKESNQKKISSGKSTLTVMTGGRKIQEGSRNITLLREMTSYFLREAKTEADFTEGMKEHGVAYAREFFKENMIGNLKPGELEEVTTNAFNYAKRDFDPSKKARINPETGKDIQESMTELFLVEEIVSPELSGQVRFLEDVDKWAVWDQSLKGNVPKNQWVTGVEVQGVPSKIKHMVSAVLKDKTLESLKNNYPKVFDPSHGDEKASKFRSYVEKWACGYQQNKNITHVVSLFKCDPKITAQYSRFDTRKVGNYFPVDNGVIDLKTGDLFDHSPEMMITRRAGIHGRYDGIRYDPQATCPNWEKFIKQITCEDVLLANYLQRFFGYVMSAGNPERKLFTFYGEGRNGKSTVMNVVATILGQASEGGFFRQIPVTTFTKKQHDSNGEELTYAVKARLAVASESGEFRFLDEAMIKNLTGNEEITYRKMHVGTLTAVPDFTVVILTNHPLKFSATDQAMVDRVVQVPFNYRVPEGDENRNLLTELLAEREGILAWMVRGAVQYAKDGLGTCSAVEEATEAYVKENNSVTLFLEDCVKKVPSVDIQAKEMLERYRVYCKDPLEATPLSGKALGKELEKLGYKKKTRGGNKVFWLNVDFKEEDEKGEEEDTGGDPPF